MSIDGAGARHHPAHHPPGQANSRSGGAARWSRSAPPPQGAAAPAAARELIASRSAGRAPHPWLHHAQRVVVWPPSRRAQDAAGRPREQAHFPAGLDEAFRTSGRSARTTATVGLAPVTATAAPLSRSRSACWSAVKPMASGTTTRSRPCAPACSATSTTTLFAPHPDDQDCRRHEASRAAVGKTRYRPCVRLGVHEPLALRVDLAAGLSRLRRRMVGRRVEQALKALEGAGAGLASRLLARPALAHAARAPAAPARPATGLAFVADYLITTAPADHHRLARLHAQYAAPTARIDPPIRVRAPTAVGGLRRHAHLRAVLPPVGVEAALAVECAGRCARRRSRAAPG